MERPRRQARAALSANIVGSLPADSVSLTYREKRKLVLEPGSHPRGVGFLSAASGLVRVRDKLYVIADDELHLGVFAAAGDLPVALVRLLDGDLPASAKKRKALKPDFESWLVLPASDESPHGSLLALGSGSRPNRFVGALASLDARGEVSGLAKPVDLKPLYADVFERFAKLNIEGAFASGESLVLLQRGSGEDASAAIRYDLAEVTAWLAGRVAGALRACSVRSVDLGAADGIPFAFTDGAALPDGAWVFSAVAEDRDDSYTDGPCVAAGIGICGSDDVVRSFERLEPMRKVEGIEVSVVGTTAFLSLVTDADDPDRAAELGTARLELPVPVRSPDAPRSP